MQPLRVSGCSANLHTDQCIKIVWRHHLTLCWVLTLSPLGCDINKPGGKRNCYPRSSLFAWCLLHWQWTGLAWLGFISGGDCWSVWHMAHREKTITLKAVSFQMTRIHTRQMYFPPCHSVKLRSFQPTLWVRNDSPTSKKPPVNYSACLF